MKILYLKPERGRPFFYADPDEVRVAEAERPAGALGRMARKWDEIEARWKESEGRAARWSRRVWDRLNAWTKPDEPLLARLATADAITIRHPTAIPAKKVQAAWRRYLRARAGSHWFWLLVDGLLAPITGVILWILPGPNVIFFWVAYRAYNHYAIVQAIHRARWESPPIAFEPDEALDLAVHHGDHGGWTHGAVADPHNLRGFIERRKPSDDPDEPEHDDADADADADFPSIGRA